MSAQSDLHAAEGLIPGHCAWCDEAFDPRLEEVEKAVADLESEAGLR